MKRYINIFFVSIAVLLSIITRLYKLGEIPAGLYLDEAGQGYSAYSILLTGKDEFGKSFPFVFRSFTDFKTPIYIYLIVPLIPIFGLTSFAVRFPSFFFSILTIPLLYLLINKLLGNFYKLKTKLPLTDYRPLASIACIFLAISPWHILFGRTNFECNVALFFLLAGIYFFYKGLDKPKYLLLSAGFFAIALPSYHAQRVVVPLMLLILFIKYRRKLFSISHKRYVIFGAIIGLLITLPTLTVASTPGFLARASGLNIFTVKDKSPYGTINKDDLPLKTVVNNRIFLATKEFASLYVSYFSPRYMFQLGDYGPRSSFPELSTFFTWQAPFYLLGIYALFRKKIPEDLKFFTLSLLFISPIPAAVTRDPYSSIRALQMVIPQTIIISIGIVNFFYLIKRPMLKGLVLSFFVVIIIYSLAKIYSSVIILNEYYRSGEWNYGWQQVSETLKKLNPEIPVVVDSARGEPYIELLFFLKYDPEKYIENNYEVGTEDYYTKMSRLSIWNLGHITVRPIDWTPDTMTRKYLVGDGFAISDDQVMKHNLLIIKDIFYPDGVLAFRIAETNPK